MTIENTTRLHPGARIGPFVMRGLIGSGGMGDVWLANHREQELEVAVKVIGAHVDESSDVRDSFAREARAVAGLAHDGIVSVYDYGLLDGKRPFLVMEYAPRGSLERLIPSMDWSLARQILLDVCDALAHAHARGIVHKDLKPGNVLLADREDHITTLLTDFGVAHALAGHVGALAGAPARSNDNEEPDARAAGAGTPAYMPPEQLLGHWREFGPWTDLYALGCMAWEMVTGAPPFDADNLVQLASMHLFEELPRLDPRFEVPVGLEHWLRRLLRKRTWERYPSAADAAWALHQIPATHTHTTWSELEARHDVRFGAIAGLDGAGDSSAWIAETKPFATISWGEAPTVIWSGRDGETPKVERVQTLLSHAVRFVAPGDEPGPLQATGELPSLRPPWPEDWRLHREGAVSVLAGAGLGIFGLRELPLVGRERERDRLWRLLGESTHGAMRAVLVRGASGVGKSRLAEWLAVRAQEVGAAVSLRVKFGAAPTPGDGIIRALAHHFQVVGLTHEDCRKRLEEELSRLAPTEEQAIIEQEASVLARAIAARGGEGEERIAQPGEREQRSALASVLSRMALRRALLVWLDDAQWGATSLGFLEELFEHEQLHFPALFMLTVRDDLLSERPREAASLERLGANAIASTIEVEPLDASEHRELVHRLLGFEDELAERIVERTLGNPLFAVQLVGDWIERGLLQPAGGGFELVEDARVELPDDLHSLWRQRIGRLLAQRFGGDSVMLARQALEIAATLGLEVDEREWETACMLAGVIPPVGLVELLLQQRLARDTREGWALVHGMLRESIERVARDAGRARQHHLTCMDMLRTLYGEHAMGHAERVAQHAIAAGELEAALHPLIDASYHEQVSGRYAAAAETLLRYDRILAKLQITQDDIRWARGQVQHFWLDWTQGGASAPLRQRVEALANLAEREGWEEILGECWRWRGLVARFEEGAEASLSHLERARKHYAEIGDEEGQARCLLSMAVALRGMRSLERAQACLVQAVELASRSDFFVLLPRCFGNLAEVSLQLGDFDRAEERFSRAEQVARDVGDRKALAFAVGGQGELALARGDLDLAAAKWSQAETIFAAVGSSYARVARVHLAAILAARGSMDESYRLLSRVLEREPLRDPLARAIAHLTLASCAGTRGHWDDLGGWDMHLDRAVEELAETREARYALALAGDLAARVAERAGMPTRARQARALVRVTNPSGQ